MENMICKCKEDMQKLMGDEFAELYYCTSCEMFVLKNIECVEKSIYMREFKI